MEKLEDVLRERRVIQAALAATIRRSRSIANSYAITDVTPLRPVLLLRMSEGLIAAHRAAKVDDDGYTLDLIEDAMRHVGMRLAKEHGSERNFSRKGLGSV